MAAVKEINLDAAAVAVLPEVEGILHINVRFIGGKDVFTEPQHWGTLGLTSGQ